MTETDIDKFTAALDGACALLSRGSYQPNVESTLLFFRSMQAYPLSTVLRALTAHVSDPQRGRFVPVPADLIAQIDGAAANDGRPGAEEAWAIAVRAADEAATIVWTEEMAQAWGACSSVMNLGDEVGARMAFKEAYNRLVEDARRLQRPVQWTPTLGHDLAQRHEALSRAEVAGLLPGGEALRLAPPTKVERKQLSKLLETSVQRQAAASNEAITDPDVIKQRAAALKARLLRREPDLQVAARQRAAVSMQKAAIDARVAEYQRLHPEADPSLAAQSQPFDELVDIDDAHPGSSPAEMMETPREEFQQGMA